MFSLKKVFALVLLTGLLGALNPLVAAPREPLEVVQDNARQLIQALRENRTKLEGNPGQIYALVDQIVLPHFDFTTMARWVLGRNWRQASPEQRQAFTEQFRNLLVNTYGNALLEYSGEELSFPANPVVGQGDDVTVRSQIQPARGPVLSIQYSMHLTEDGWKVYDVTIDGISLVTNYRNSFATQIRATGLDGLIADLRQRNARGIVN